MSDTPQPGHDRVCSILATLLRGAFAKGQTDDVLSAATCISPRTIKSYRVDGKEPSLSNALSLLAALGPAAMNAVLGVVEYGGAAPLDEIGRADPRRIVADLLPHVSTIAAASADGRIDHTEQSACENAANHIIAAVAPLTQR